MPCYLLIDGKKQEIDEDIFDQMVEALHQPATQEPSIQTSNRWKRDGTYDSKPLDPEYFSKYYQKTLTTPFKCPDCGRTISSKSNLSKHRQTNIFMRNRCQCWTMLQDTLWHLRFKGLSIPQFSQQQSFLLRRFLCWCPTPIPEIPTGDQSPKLLKEMPPYRV